jgi:hypothetical protein
MQNHFRGVFFVGGMQIKVKTGFKISAGWVKDQTKPVQKWA